MNKSFLAAIVAVFAHYPEAQAVYVCEDGSVFLEERRNLAENYSRENRFGAPKLVTREEADDLNEAMKRVEASVDDSEAQKQAEAAAAEKARSDAEAAAADAETKEIAAAEADGVVVKKDGSAWLAHRNDFINLQESPAGYGDTIAGAVASLKMVEAALESAAAKQAAKDAQSAAAEQAAQDAARQAEKDNKPNNGKRR